MKATAKITMPKRKPKGKQAKDQNERKKTPVLAPWHPACS